MNVSLNTHDDDVVRSFLFGLLGVPVGDTESLAARLGNDVALRECGQILVSMCDRFYRNDSGEGWLSWGRELLRATIAGGLPAGVNRDRWSERLAVGY